MLGTRWVCVPPDSAAEAGMRKGGYVWWYTGSITGIFTGLTLLFPKAKILRKRIFKVVDTHAHAWRACPDVSDCDCLMILIAWLLVDTPLVCRWYIPHRRNTRNIFYWKERFFAEKYFYFLDKKYFFCRKVFLFCWQERFFFAEKYFYFIATQRFMHFQ